MPGVENTEKALRSVLELARPTESERAHHGEPIKVLAAGPAAHNWIIPIQRTVSLDGQGISELAEHILRHHSFLHTSMQWVKRNETRLTAEVDSILQHMLVLAFQSKLPEGRYNEVMQQVFARRLSPGEAVESLLDGKLGEHNEPVGGRSQ
jgi:putative protein kinase ArgK-like GTPase of G3E family